MSFSTRYCGLQIGPDASPPRPGRSLLSGCYLTRRSGSRSAKTALLRLRRHRLIPAEFLPRRSPLYRAPGGARAWRENRIRRGQGQTEHGAADGARVPGLSRGPHRCPPDSLTSLLARCFRAGCEQSSGSPGAAWSIRVGVSLVRPVGPHSPATSRHTTPSEDRKRFAVGRALPPEPKIIESATLDRPTGSMPVERPALQGIAPPSTPSAREASCSCKTTWPGSPAPPGGLPRGGSAQHPS